MEQEFYTENVSACAPPVREKLEPNLSPQQIIFSCGVKDTAPYWDQQLCIDDPFRLLALSLFKTNPLHFFFVVRRRSSALASDMEHTEGGCLQTYIRVGIAPDSLQHSF